MYGRSLCVAMATVAMLTVGCANGPDDPGQDVVTPLPKGPITIEEGQPCLPGALKPGVFADVGIHLGVDFVHDAYPDPDPFDDSPYRWEDFAGVAVADLDHDGALDLVLTNGGGPSRLFLTGGRGPAQWQASDLVGREPIRVVTVGDVNGDGFRDLAMLSRHMPLWRQGDGKGGFAAEQPLRPGGQTAGPRQELGWDLEFSSFSLALGDLDGDGILDAYIGNQEEFDVTTDSPPWPGRELLLMGAGDGQFTDQSAWIPPRGIDDMTFIVVMADLDDDGDLDIYEINDAIPLEQLGIVVDPIWGPAQGNRLYENAGLANGELQLLDITDGSGADVVIAGMGAAVGDYDNDGLLDLYVATMLPDHNALLHNDGQLAFSDTTDALGADTMSVAHDVAWGAIFLDGDMDGWQDLLVLHGFIEASNSQYRTNPLKPPNVWFKNDGGKAFVDASASSGLGGDRWSRSPAVGDLNRDGFPDLVVGNVDAAPYIYLNGCDERPWLTVKLDRAGPNADGIGARIRVTSTGPDKTLLTQTRHILAGSEGLYGSSAPEAYFGFPVGTTTASVEVRWPDGTISTWPDLSTRRIVTIRE